MIKEKQVAYDFIKRRSVLPEQIDFLKCTEAFVGEMEKGLCGNSSLPMLPTYLSIEGVSVKNEKVIVIDAGGTNFRSAVVCFDDNGVPEIKSFSKHRMPGTNDEVNADIFFKEMAELIRPIANESDKIGFCFSYPLEMTKEKDGKFLFITKELKVKGAEGLLVGESFIKALGSHKKVVLLNDTVAALLGGIAAYNSREFGSYGGFILGTGLNAAYIESNKNIKKDAEISASSGSMIINIESGNFNRAPMGELDDILTKSTQNPLEFRFEKMVSGAYLGMNLLVALKEAAKEGILTKQYSEKLSGYTNFDGGRLYEFLSYPYKNGDIAAMCQNESDRLFTYYLAEYVCERAAKLAAINVAALVRKSGAGQNPLKPVCVLVEGTTYYKAKFIKDRIAHYLKEYLNDEMHLYADLLPADDVTLIGSAIAGLL